jgi:hypothetical protein
LKSRSYIGDYSPTAFEKKYQTFLSNSSSILCCALYHLILVISSHLQPTIMPKLLAGGVAKPNRQRIIEGATLLERAQNAMDALRRKEVSGERLVWRVAE